MVIIDGFSLYQSLRACRNQLARGKLDMYMYCILTFSEDHTENKMLCVVVARTLESVERLRTEKQ